MSDQQVEILAAQLAPRMAGDQMARLTARYTASLGQRPQTAGQQQVRKPIQKAPAPQPRRQSTIPARTNGMKMVFTNQQPQPPKIQYTTPQPEYNMEVVQRPTKQQRPTPEEVVERYAEPEEYYQPDIEEGEEEAADFLSETDRDIPINHNGHRIG